jgi:membrane protease YdiL (CAAX protease family)
VAGLVLTVVRQGRGGIQELIARLRQWQAPFGVWAAVVLTNPLAVLAVLVALSVFIGPEYSPDFTAIGLAVGLLAGVCEEIGWTGFATPRLLQKYSAVHAGLILGLVWAVWHGFADFAANIGHMTPGAWVTYFAAYWAVPLIAYRVLMTWAYAVTGSLLVAIVAHASYTGWHFALAPAVSLPLTPTGDPGAALIWYATFAAILTVAVAAIVWASPVIGTSK